MKRIVVIFLILTFGIPCLSPAATGNAISIASFNIQVFGVTKAGKPEVMDVLAKTIANFDIVAIQEIRDASGTAIMDLLAAVDALGSDYEVVVGPRLGRTSSKEQYAFMYRVSKISYRESYTYDDSASDLFHREPFIASFSAVDGNFDFVLATIHTDPDEATEEIDALPLVVADAKSHFAGELDIIVLGDFNADCSYFNEDDATCPLRDPSYVWLISNDADTNLASSSCTYDRIVTTTDSQAEFTGAAGVYRFDQVFNLTDDAAGDVSDHYPVYAQFNVDDATEDAGSTDTVVDGGYNVTADLWCKGVLQVPGAPVILKWNMVGADLTPSGDQVISGYFYADPNDFAYGSVYNPELFVKIYIATGGWCNVAFNHVTVDPVTVYSAHHYTGIATQTGSATIDSRLVQHEYTGVSIDTSKQSSGGTSGSAGALGYTLGSNLWSNAVLQVAGNPVTLIWKEVGTDTTPSGAKVISGYFYADPATFAYGSAYNPEVFVKVYIDPTGWANMAFNHVTVDPVSIDSAYQYAGAAEQSGSVTLNGRLQEHAYTGVPIQ